MAPYLSRMSQSDRLLQGPRRGIYDFEGREIEAVCGELISSRHARDRHQLLQR